MPEGPSIVILKEEIARLQLEGKPIIAVEGNTSIEKDRLINYVQEFRSWGKHFLICFNGFYPSCTFHAFRNLSYKRTKRNTCPFKFKI